ncbi:MAG: hypothetical protein M3680_31280 [Myxococcota bacterium]|nr:hypothetical protein [Myxococcota bacterium]
MDLVVRDAVCLELAPEPFARQTEDARSSPTVPADRAENLERLNSTPRHLATAVPTGTLRRSHSSVPPDRRLALRIQDALSPGKAPEHPVARFTLRRGTYLVEQLPRIASSEGAQIVPVRLTKQ